MREAPMRKVNPAAKRVLDELTMGLAQIGDHRKLDNAKGAFMPVSVEIIDTGRDGYVWVSVAHYGEQNGDLIADPDVELHYPSWVPTGITQAFFGYRSKFIERDGKTYVDTRFHKEVSSFLSMWARNIKAQGWAEAGRVSDD